MDIVSFETAKRLKEVGFPQKRVAHSMWYCCGGIRGFKDQELCVYMTGYMAMTYMVPTGFPNYKFVVSEQDFDDFILVPDVSDLVKALGWADIVSDGHRFGGYGESSATYNSLCEMLAERFINDNND